jgi:hypothetical protein
MNIPSYCVMFKFWTPWHYTGERIPVNCPEKSKANDRLMQAV